MLSEVIERKLEGITDKILNEVRRTGKAGIIVGFDGETGEVLKANLFSQEKIRKEAKKAVNNLFKDGEVKLDVAYYDSNFLFLVLSKK